MQLADDVGDVAESERLRRAHLQQPRPDAHRRHAALAQRRQRPPGPGARAARLVRSQARRVCEHVDLADVLEHLRLHRRARLRPVPPLEVGGRERRERALPIGQAETVVDRDEADASCAALTAALAAARALHEDVAAVPVGVEEANVQHRNALHLEAREEGGREIVGATVVLDKALQRAHLLLAHAERRVQSLVVGRTFARARVEEGAVLRAHARRRRHAAEVVRVSVDEVRRALVGGRLADEDALAQALPAHISRESLLCALGVVARARLLVARLEHAHHRRPLGRRTVDEVRAPKAVVYQPRDRSGV
mmetsp:Transcript_41533/g.97189  ORF Transcript_41533/g.97189 Transcript_41533/m.97189 type:complete len:309 (-) Transcript_41533:504-1430(-)